MNFKKLPALSLLICSVAFLIGVFLYNVNFWNLTSPIMAETRERMLFPKKIVHFDLKGAPPKVSYIVELIKFFKKLGVSGILLEYEDMFPYSGKLEYLRRPDCYSEAEIEQIIQVTQANDIQVVPLIQTFGHLEFVLKHTRFRNLRENQSSSDTICPSKPESYELIADMLQQVRKLHVNSSIIHIGADEAQYVGQDRDCEKKLNELNNSIDRLKLWHITRVASLAKKIGFREVWAWNDMFGKIRTNLLVESGIGNLLTPVVWGYSTDVTSPGYFPGGMFKRFSLVFDNILFGSAFKGANGIGNAFIDVFRYLSNQMSYVKLLRKNSTELHDRVSGIVLTGWQRYNHFAPLCELLPVGIPSLALSIHYLDNVHRSRESLIKMTQATLGCPLLRNEEETVRYGGLILTKPFESTFRNGTFPGHEVFDLVEDLRLLTSLSGRQNTTVSTRLMVKADATRLQSQIRDTFGKFFSTSAIEEFIGQNVAALSSSPQVHDVFYVPII